MYRNSQAIQCDLCGVWVHAVCDGLSKDQYQGLVSLTSGIENLAYLGKLNSCQAQFKQMIFEIAKATTDSSKIQKRLKLSLINLYKKLTPSSKTVIKLYNQFQVVLRLLKSN